MSVPEKTAYAATTSLLGRTVCWTERVDFEDVTKSGEVVAVSLVTQHEGTRATWLFLVLLPDGAVETLDTHYYQTRFPPAPRKRPRTRRT